MNTAKSYADALKEFEALADTPEAQELLRREGLKVTGRMKDGTPVYKAVAPPAPIPKGPAMKPLTAEELALKRFEELRQPVENFICQGLTLLVGASKIGKSWLALDLCMSVAAGEPFLGKRTAQGEVLYLALEDSEQRLQSRMRKLGRPAPAGLHLAAQASTLDQGLIGELNDWMKDHKGATLMVIDTLQKVRGIPPARANAYQQDYQTMGVLKDFADSHRLALVLVHHTNKMRNVEDPYDKISGSTGLMGAADTAILIERDRGTDEATVHVTGRDVWGQDFVIRLQEGRWVLAGKDAAGYAAQKAYEASPVARLLKALAEENPSGIRLTYAQLLGEGLNRFGEYPALDAKDLARRIKEVSPQLCHFDSIAVEVGIRLTEGKGVRLCKRAPETPPAPGSCDSGVQSTWCV